MAKRKSTTVQEEMVVVSNRIKELKALHEQAVLEEKNLIDNATAEIKEIADKYNVFCGLIITKADLINLTTVMLENGGQNLNVDFRIYHKE